MAPTSSMGKILYGLLFVVFLPSALIVWARLTEPVVKLPIAGSPTLGMILAVIGTACMLAGMTALFIYGKGLPMNAYPPAHFVTRGVYAITPHPIYAGFCMICVGVAMAANSPSGLWLVCPSVILGCVALVEGYEKEDLRQRFPSTRSTPILRLPSNEPTAPEIWDRLSIYVLVFLPWGLLYEAVRFLGIPRDAITAYTAVEQGWPVVEWTSVFYASAYVFALLAPLIARKKCDLRQFAVAGLLGTGITFLCFLAFPVVAPPRAFVARSFAGNLLAFERAHDTAAAAFPSFHVFWAMLAARLYSQAHRRMTAVWWGLAAAIGISCITTGMHAVVDVVAGFAVSVIVIRIERVWESLRRMSERIANSWREWRLGPVRIINHGIYGGLAAFLGFSIAGTLLGPDYLVPMALLSLSVLVGAALWAQYVEGSPNLLRPFGWYGGVLGAVIGALLSILIGADPWLMLAAFSVAGPWIQSAGRLRCLVQGCCHGHLAPDSVGIRYTHPRSRVCRLSDLTGRPVHPTPLYSILWNIVVAVVMARLWLLQFPLTLIVGANLIITGMGRFVEEAFRGEPQTPIRAGLRLYQWMAILSVVAGIVVTTIADTHAAPRPQPNLQTLLAAVCLGAFTWAALGVDFPESDRRFSRLA